MNDAEATQLILEIIHKAQRGQAQPFRTILYWNEFRYYTKFVRSTKLVIRTLEQSANKLFKEYCQDVVAGISDINKLVAYSQLLDFIEFYQNDLKTVQAMLIEYDDYLGEGNFWYSFLGGRREL